MAARTDTAEGRPFWLLLIACVLVVGTGAKPPGALGQELSGTITYTGTRVVVSDSAPIFVFLVAFDPNVHGVDRAYVPTNGGPFVLHAPAAGNYYLLYSVDIHDYRDDSMSVGAPFEVYNNRYAFSFPAPFPADPIYVPQEGVNLTFSDTAILSGIAGRVTYTGIQHVTPGGSLVPQASSSPDFNGEPDRSYDYAQRKGRYELILLDAGRPYYLRAFLDLNSNGHLDGGEPSGLCSNPITAGPDQTGVIITFADQGPATCVVLPPPPPALCGDCNGDGTVGANEITQVISNVFKSGGGPARQ